jgi:hypothetical protein
MRSYSDQRLNVLTPQTTQTVYPKVIGPSLTQVSVPAQSVVRSSLPVQSVARSSLPVQSVVRSSLPVQSVARSSVPAQSVVRSSLPTPSYTERYEIIGTERFDPDPITTTTRIPGRSVRETVRGPYGLSGENVLISGVHKLPGQMVYSTADISEHEVRSVHNGYNKSSAPIVNTLPNKVSYPQPAYNARTEQIGTETFDPDPVTKVSEIPSRSVRTAVKGPYGPNGETVLTTGVYTAPGRRVYSTVDVPEHEVRSVPRPGRNAEF